MSGKSGAVSGKRLVLAVMLAACLAALFYSRNPLTSGARHYAQSVATSSGGVYLTLRSLNAFLSTAQEVEVGGSFVVQGSAQPFKMLEPIDDTVERIASMVFVVMVITGVLSVTLGPVSALGYAMIAGAALLALVGGRWPGRLAAQARPLAVYGAFLAIVLPGAFLLSSLIAGLLTADVLAAHEAVLAEISAEVELGAEAVGAGSTFGWLQSMRADVERYATLATTIYDRADALIASFLAIFAVYVFKLLILPGLITGGLLALFRSLGRVSPR